MMDQNHTTAAPIVSVRNLQIERQGQGDTPDFHLNVVEFDVHPGARVGLIGESGSGKTTLLETLGLLAWPDEIQSYAFTPEMGGETVELADALQERQATALSHLRARNIGFVLQDGGLLPYLTVRGNAELSRTLSGQTSNPIRIADLAETMGIAAYLDRPQSALSGGQRQRAAVLRALAPGVPLLLADEPTASLDAQTAHKVMEALVMSAEALGTTVIVSSHNADLLRDFGFTLIRVDVDEQPDVRRARLVSA